MTADGTWRGSRRRCGMRTSGAGVAGDGCRASYRSRCRSWVRWLCCDCPDAGRAPPFFASPKKGGKERRAPAPAARCASGARVSGPSGGACATRCAQTGAGSNPPADPLTRQAPNGQKQKQKPMHGQRQGQHHASSLVVPAQAGTQVHHRSHWAPAFAGVTHEAPSFPRNATGSPRARGRRIEIECSVSTRATNRNRVLRLHARDEAESCTPSTRSETR